MVTSEREELVVQLTPYGIEVPQLVVTGRSTDRIVVEASEPAETTVSSTVEVSARATRSKVVRDARPA